MNRRALTVLYLVALSLVVAVANWVERGYDLSHPNDLVELLYLCIAAPLLNIPQVRIEEGRLSLVGVANQASALILNPLGATLVGITSSISTLKRGSFPLFANAVF